MATAAALGACCLAAVGCGSSAALDPLAGKTGRQVLAKAVEGLMTAPSFTETSAGVESGRYGSASKGMVPGKGCTGTLLQGAFGAQGTLIWITIGETVYFKPDDNAWQSIAGTDAAKIIQVVDGRYVKDPVSDARLGPAFSCVIYTPGKALVTRGEVTMLNGIRVLPLKTPGGGVIYVTDTSKPEFVEVDDPPVTGTKAPANKTIYTIGAPVTLTPPPASQVIDGSEVNF
jgi:hypothetical protein